MRSAEPDNGRRAKPPSGTERRRRNRRRLLWFVGVVLGLVAFGFWGLPPIVKAQAVKRLSAELNRDVSIERVRINPLVLAVTIEGLTILDLDKSPFAAWRKLHVNFDSWSLFRREWGFQEIVLDSFSGRVVRASDGALNFQDLLKKSPEPDREKEKSWPLAIARLEVAEARVDFADRSRPQPFATQVGPVSFTLANFRTEGDPRAPYSFAAQTEAGETIGWSGAVSVAPLRSAGELTISGVALKKYRPYLDELVQFELREGVLDVRGRYEVDLGASPASARFLDGEVQLRNLQLAASDNSQPAVEVRDLKITGIQADAATQAAAIERVAITGGRIAVRREADGLDLAQWIEPKRSSSEPRAVTSATARPAVKLGELAVTELSLALEDRTTPRPAALSVERLDLTLREFDLANLAHALPLELQAALPGGGAAKLAGTVALQPLAANFAFDVRHVPIGHASPYLESFLDVRLASGHATATGSVRLTAEAVDFKGEASIDEFQAIDGRAADTLASWSAVAVKGIAARTNPLALEIEEVALTNFLGRVTVQEEGALNVGAIFKQKSSPPSEPAAETAPTPSPPAPQLPPSIKIGRVVLENAGVQFTDRSIQPHAQLALTSLSGTISGLSSEQMARADVDLQGTIGGGAPVVVTGKLNPLGRPASTDLKLDFRNIELLPIAPYVGKYAGYQLARGTLTLDVKFNLADRKVDSANVATLNQFTLGERTDSPEATKLPVTLAIALLKDRQGRIVVDLPVQGSLDDPSFRIGKVVGRVLTNLLSKAATAPFSLLGAMFGGGGEELSFQEFPAGESELPPAELAKLDKVAVALRERPGLRVDLEPCYNAEADRVALRQAEFDRRVRALVWEELRQQDTVTPPPEQIEVTPEQRLAAIQRWHARSFSETAELTSPPNNSDASPLTSPPVAPTPREEKRGFVGWLRSVVGLGSREVAAQTSEKRPESATAAPAPARPVEAMEQQLRETLVVDENALRELASIRAQHVKNYLLQQGQVPAEQVFLLAPATKGSRVNLQLK